ncbi:unnamed protein product, partial [Ectocarpus sp. 4 AP-2014]
LSRNRSRGPIPTPVHASSKEHTYHITMEVPPENFERFSYRQLQKMAKSRGLNAGGKKQDILARLQEQNAAQQKENAVPKPKCSTAPKPQHQPPSGKENDTHAGPRKTKTLPSLGASPRLVKKAL